MKKLSSAMQDLNMDKKEMVNTVLILMGMDNDQFHSQFMKLSIATLNVMYEQLTQNAVAHAEARRQERFAKEHLAVAERRIASLERTLQKRK